MVIDHGPKSGLGLRLRVVLLIGFAQDPENDDIPSLLSSSISRPLPLLHYKSDFKSGVILHSESILTRILTKSAQCYFSSRLGKQKKRGSEAAAESFDRPHVVPFFSVPSCNDLVSVRIFSLSSTTSSFNMAASFSSSGSGCVSLTRLSYSGLLALLIRLTELPTFGGEGRASGRPLLYHSQSSAE